MASRPLSFIVFGVPRSGTKGLARGLNLHPNVLCAQERFDQRADHSRLRFPESFLDGPRVMPQVQLRKLERLRAEAARKPEILHVGNKFPRYYLALERINAEVPGLRNLLIHRSPYGVLPSWDRKEASATASGWYAGQVGLFGFLELIACLQSAVRQPGVFLFPYELGLNESAEPLEAALDFIGADPALLDRETFASEHMPRRVDSKRRWELAAHERDLLDHLHAADLDDLLARNWGVIGPAVAKQVSDYLEGIAPLLPEAVDEAIAAYDNPAAVAYGARFMAANRDELAELREICRGSAFMSDIERARPWRRVTWPFVQRSFLKRRLRSMRRTRAQAGPDAQP